MSTKAENIEKPGAPAGAVDLFAGCPPANCWKRDQRFHERAPQLWGTIILAPQDRAVACEIASSLLDEAGPARVDLSRFIARLLEQRPQLRPRVAQASLDQLDEFFTRVRARRAQLAAGPAGGANS